MGKRPLTPAEIRAYQDLARAAKRLRRAQQRAERRRQPRAEGRAPWLTRP